MLELGLGMRLGLGLSSGFRVRVEETNVSACINSPQ